MEVNEIRKQLKNKRNALTSKQVKEYSLAICEKFFSLDFISDKVSFFVYNSINNEVDTTYIISKLSKGGKTISYPLTQGGEMLAVIPTSSEFIVGNFGVKIPKDYKVATSVDVSVIPLLACDKNLNRIGYGKGYYDKFLSKNDCIKVGICYDFQVIENIIAKAWDIKLDYIITPSTIIK